MVFFFKDFAKTESYFFFYFFEIEDELFSRNNFFLNKYLNIFEIESFGSNKTSGKQ